MHFSLSAAARVGATITATASLCLPVLTALPATAAPISASLVKALPATITTQLPRTVRPTHYDVSITPDAAGGRFSARVVIDITVLSATDAITLNAADLSFQQAVLTTANGVRATPATASVDAANQTATFRLPLAVAPGNYRLALDYTGLIGTQAVGLFSLDYDNAAGRKRALYTQFENSDARRMIPSWDEPAYKASFALRATVPAAEMAVSNMPVASSRALPNGKTLVTFQQTPVMSTYLLFFGLGEFERATTKVDGTELGVITQKGTLSQARFALDSSAAILREYNDYFGVRYPLPKLDNIAAPGRSQFFGAMENWGAIFTFEHVILLDPSISTQTDKQRSFSIAAHEMAHQWFGDLVTMQWWDDLWLNEGFASWMESRTTARLHPEWKTALDAVNVREDAMNRDAFLTTHPVVQHVETVEQASQAFDAITYQKGESVIRMLEHYVGADTWRTGVRRYMAAHAYGNTATDDLWREVERAAGKPITAIAHDFTLQPGVPMIRVEADACVDGMTAVKLTQTEFSRDQPGKKPLSWRVPVSVQAGVDGKPVTTLVEGAASLRVPGCGPILANGGQTGYYRTVYAAPAFKRLGADFARLAPIDQLGLLSDTWALGITGLQPVSDFLDLAQAAPLDAEPQVWSNITQAFGAIERYYRNDPQRRARFDNFAVARLAPVINRLGWNAKAGEAETVPPLRELLIRTLSQMDDPVTIAEARRRYAAPAGDTAAMPAPLRKTILSVVAEHADAATWEALHRTAQAEKSPMIKNDLYDMLAAPRDRTLAQKALELALTDEPDITTGSGMLAGVASVYPDMAFDFALANIDKVNQRVDTTSRSRFFPSLAANSGDPAMIGKIEDYAKAQLAQGSRREADTAVARIRDRIRVRQERLPEIDAWLARQHG